MVLEDTHLPNKRLFVANTIATMPLPKRVKLPGSGVALGIIGVTVFGPP
jgi:hypothetical protein